MAKEKVSILKEIDNTLDDSYTSLEKEIEAMQIRIAIADREADRKIRKKLKKNPDKIVSNRQKISIRNEILDEMEETNFIERVTTALKIATPICVVIAKLCACLIQLILSIDLVRRNMSPSLLSKLLKLHQFCVGLKLV